MRSGGLVCAALLLAVSASGCFFEPDYSELEAIFGTDRFQYGTMEDVVRIRVANDTSPEAWRSELAVAVTPPTLVVEKGETPPSGGGGETHDLELPGEGLPAIEMRFDEHERLYNYTAEWTVYKSGVAGIAHEVTAAADEVVAFQPNGTGTYRIAVDLLLGSQYMGWAFWDAEVVLNVTWLVESSIHPVRVQGAPMPADYDEMRDAIRVHLEEGQSLRTSTSFRGEYDPARDGTDVDLDLFNPAMESLGCIGSGGGASPFPTPEAATEILFLGHAAQTGTYEIGVGAMHRACSENAWYHNQGPVPYTLRVTVE